MKRTLLCTMLLAAPMSAQQAAPVLRLGAFVDGYYAWDSGRPTTHDRAFTTQAVRHDEFNVNLAFLEASVSADRVRGRLALQAGTSVQANYAGEPTTGSTSGASLARNLQEAVAGVRLAPAVWLDAGIFFSHIGQESWISRDNPTYTRSFTAEYTPYYSSGVKATWTPDGHVSLQLHLINGWQNIAENNAGKAVGARVDWTPRRRLALGWASFAGNEQPDTAPGRTRVFQQLFAQWRLADALTLWATVDAGWERRRAGPVATWGSATLIGEYQLSPVTSVAARVERFLDRDGVLIRVAAPRGFAVTSSSLGVNVRLPEGLQWRSEARLYRSDYAVWPVRAGTARHATALVTSLSLSLHDRPPAQ